METKNFREVKRGRFERLVGAAYRVGMTHAWFRELPELSQWLKVWEWSSECLLRVDDRRQAAAYSTRSSGAEHIVGHKSASTAGRCGSSTSCSSSVATNRRNPT